MKTAALLMWSSVLLSGSLSADNFATRWAEFQQKVKPFAKQLREQAPQSDTEPVEAFSKRVELARAGRMLEELQAVPVEGQPQQIRDVLGQIDRLRRTMGLPPELRSLLDAMVAEFPKLLEKQRDEWLAEVDRVVNGAAAKCLSVQAEAELDPLLREPSKLAEESARGSSDNEMEQRAQRRLSAAIRTVSTWQDYLAQFSLGNEAAATAVLKRLESGGDYPIVPKDEIAKRLIPKSAPVNPRAQQAALLRRIQKVEDLGPAIAELRDLLGRDSNGSQNYVMQALGNLQSAWVTNEAGFTGEAFQKLVRTPIPSTLGELHGEFVRIRGLLLRAMLPRYLATPNLPALSDEESLPDYLLRAVEGVVSSRRYPEALRLLETYRAVSFGDMSSAPPWIQGDLNGLAAFAAAERFEQARCWADAIRFYRDAASSNGRFTPLVTAAKRLGELQEKHPQEADLATRMAEAEAAYKQAARNLESRMPPDIRARMMPPPYSP